MKNTKLIIIGILSVISLAITTGTFVSATYNLDVLKTKNDTVVRAVLSEIENNKNPERLTEIAKRYIDYSTTQRHERHKRGVKQLKLMSAQALLTLFILILLIIELKKRKNAQQQNL